MELSVIRDVRDEVDPKDSITECDGSPLLHQPETLHGDGSEESLLPTTVSHSQNSSRDRGSLLSRRLATIASWAKGPDPPRPYKIEAWLPAVQNAPLRLFDRVLPQRRHRIWSLLLLLSLWVVSFASILYKSIASTTVPGYGVPVRLACHAQLWPNSTICGLDGDRCRPFDNHSFAFSCPADCESTKLLEPYVVGAKEINYRSLVVGGRNSRGPDTSVYRGDSFVCAAALHAGIISNEAGGCGIVSRVGEANKFPSVDANGISSIGYDSNFPLSFTFAEPASPVRCKDLRWHVLAVTVLFTTVLSVFTTPPGVFFASTFVMIYFHVALVSDPPNLSDVRELVSRALGRFLPAAFVGFVIYRYCVRYTLRGLRAPYEKTVLWLGGCWFGALENYTLDRLPLSRLTPHDLHQQPGAMAVLVSIIGIILAIALGQAWAFRVEGRMPRYLALYGLMVGFLLVCATVPRMNLRVHHYILALLLLPGTALQTRPSLLYQGLLVGLFLNGIARWGFDSVLQTPSQLLNGAPSGSLLPQIMPPLVGLDNLTFAMPKVPRDFYGISVLVNDVERYRMYSAAEPPHFVWTRHRQGESEYFRFGYMGVSALGSIWYGDFTRPATWEGNGTWEHMLPGPITTRGALDV